MSMVRPTRCVLSSDGVRHAIQGTCCPVGSPSCFVFVVVAGCVETHTNVQDFGIKFRLEQDSKFNIL